MPNAPRLTPLWEKQGKLWHDAYTKLMADPQARLRWIYYLQCLVMAGTLPRDRYASPKDPAERQAVEAMHQAAGSNPSDAFIAYVREVDRVAPELSHSLGTSLVDWILAKTFAAAGVSPSVRLAYAPVRLAPDNPIMMDARGRWHGAEHATAKQLLDVRAALDSLRPEKKRGPRRRSPGEPSSKPTRAHDPQRCEEALRLKEKDKSDREIAIKLFGSDVLSDQKTTERYRGRVRRMIEAARANRYRARKNR